MLVVPAEPTCKPMPSQLMLVTSTYLVFVSGKPGLRAALTPDAGIQLSQTKHRLNPIGTTEGARRIGFRAANQAVR